MNNNYNNFNNMDDLFNQLMGRMGGYNSEHRRYLINGREVTPEEFAQYRATGKLPGQGTGEQTGQAAAQGPKQDGMGAIRKSKKLLKSFPAGPRIILYWLEMPELVRQLS